MCSNDDVTLRTAALGTNIQTSCCTWANSIFSGPYGCSFIEAKPEPMNQNLKSNFMQRCVVTRDPLWHAMVVWPLLWRWGHMALSSISPAVCGVLRGQWWTLGSLSDQLPWFIFWHHIEHVTCPRQLHPLSAALLTTTFAGMGGINCRTKLHPEKELRNYVFLEIFSTALLIRCNGQREELCCAWVYILSALVN